MLAFMCAAMVAVESFLYSLLQSMGLIGASYNDISNSFPDNTVQQNQVLYSIANNPTNSDGGFTPIEHRYDDEVANFFYWFVGTSEFGPFATENWDALMTDLGFSIVGNNVDVAVSNGFNPSPSASQWVGTLKAVTGEEVVVSYYGNTNTAFRYTGEVLPDNFPIQLGWPTASGAVGNIAVWRWVYDDTVVYSTSLGPGTQPYYDVYYNLTGQFEIVDNTLQFRQYRSNGQLYNSTTFSKQNWINQGIAIDDAISFEPTESVVLGEDYLSFGDTDNPVIGVTYDPSTGVTTYKYKDGTISKTPPAVLGDGVALSPSITQPLTNYIINEGDITNIYNPDAAIPSDSSVPFDFTSLGDLLYKEFTPMLTPDFKPPINRLIAKYDWETPFKKLAQKFNINGRRPSYPVTFNLFGKSITWDFWDWCDTLLTPTNYNFYLKFVRFFLYFTMVSGCISLLLRSLHVSIKTVHFGGDD